MCNAIAVNIFSAICQNVNDKKIHIIKSSLKNIVLFIESMTLMYLFGIVHYSFRTTCKLLWHIDASVVWHFFIIYLSYCNEKQYSNMQKNKTCLITIITVRCLYYNLKRCSKKECCKQCGHVKLKGTMTKYTEKHVEHQDATDIQKKTFLFLSIRIFYFIFILFIVL